MNNLNRLRPRPSHLILHHGQGFAISDLAGLFGTGGEGFYYRQTRFLSKMRFTIAGKEPQNVCAVAVNSRSSIAYYVAPTPAGRQADPQPDREGSEGEVVKKGIVIQINRSLSETLTHDIYVTNHALAPTSIVLRWELEADFADRSEAKQGERQQDAPVERSWELCGDGAVLELRYCHPQLWHATAIRFSGAGGLIEDNGTVSCLLQLSPQQPVSFHIEIVPIFCGKPVARGREIDNCDVLIRDALTDSLRLNATNAVVQRAWDRAVSDLASLALCEGEGDERLTPAGGIPEYVALFGRDSLMTAFQASFLAPAMFRGTLNLIAEWNADKYDERFDEEPGRVIHQHQMSPLALLQKNPFLHYYGDYSAPGLFLIDMAWHLALTGDKEFFLSKRDKMLATLEWMDRDGDRDHDGFYEYATRAGSWGEKNQGWKDSNDAILYEDGRMVEDPIAIVETQGCFYAAKQMLGLAFASIGDNRRAESLFAEAKKLKQLFNQAFWLTEEQFLALALDPTKKPVRTIASDAGQCLVWGIIDDAKAKAVADRLMMPDMFSGWGIRTLSADHPAFNPFAYHLGSVWPATNALIGFGFKRHGFNAQLHRLAEAMFDASELFDYERLPEVFGGQPRDRRHPHPGIYPGANSPQAWSAGAVILFIKSMLGLIPLAPRATLIIDPDLPDWLPELNLGNIRVGNARIGLRFKRDRSGYTEHEITDQQGELRIYRSSTKANAGPDRFAQLFREALCA
jgi:glycogen debranching enzyme